MRLFAASRLGGRVGLCLLMARRASRQLTLAVFPIRCLIVGAACIALSTPAGRDFRSSAAVEKEPDADGGASREKGSRSTVW